MPDISQIPTAAAMCDGGDLDCGSGLLLIIRKAMEPIAVGEILEIRSREVSVQEDLPAWCRLVGHEYLGVHPGSGDRRFFVRKGGSGAVQEQNLAQEMAKARTFVWTARVRGTGPLAARAYVRNHEFAVGQPASFSAADTAPSAVDYLLGALGADLVESYAMHASRRGVTPDALEVALRGQLGNPLVVNGLEDTGRPGFVAISATLYVRADADDQTLMAIWQEVLRRAPLVDTLRSAVQLDLRMIIDL